MTILLPEFDICQPDGTVLASPGSAEFLADFLPTGAIQDVFASLVAQPSELCIAGCVAKMVVTDGDNSITSARVKLTGIDVFGRAVQEEISTNAAGTNTYSGTVPFYTYTATVAQGVGFTATDRISLGLAPVLGLPMMISTAGNVLVARIDAAIESPPTIALVGTNGLATWTPSLAPNGARRFRAYGYTVAL